MKNEEKLVNALIQDLLINHIDYMKKGLNIDISDRKDINPNDEYLTTNRMLKKLSAKEQEYFYRFVKLAMIDTISTLLGVIDGSAFLGLNLEFKLIAIDENGVNEEIQNNLQDIFLGKVEDDCILG